MPFANLLLLPLLLLSEQTPDPQLRKCVGATGAVSYQSLPCGQGSREAWVQPIKAGSAPEPPARMAARSSARSADRRAARPASRRSVRKTAPRRASAGQARRERCKKARREADALRDRLWNKLDFQQRSDLDAKVARACARRPG
ncbi:MAG TPA: hypothetical protein VFY00_05485 [Arenimonas sp.]|nr:hypothetical protein [Arenimonas sp.]